MNLKRKFLLPLLGMIVLVLALAFASACNEHVHTYSDEWESDSTYHWHEPTCDDTDKVADKAEHTYRDGVCTVCGAAQPETENPQPDPDKKDYDMSGVMFEDLKVVYDGEAHSIFIKGELPDGVSVSYEGNGMTNVGEYTVTAHFTGDSENYQEIPDKTAKLTIEQAAVEGITFDGETVPYDGEAHSIFIKGELPDGVSVSYEGNGMTNVGEYTVIAKFTTDENHKPISDMEATLIIEKATFDMAKVKFEDETVPYDGEAHSITAANLPTGVQATYDGNGKVNAGTYQITAHFIVDTTNYNTIADRHATLTIEKIDYDLSGITFEGLTVPYDGKTHPLAIKGQLPTGVDVSYENNAQTTAGEHKVIAHFTGDTQNHNLIPDKEATLTIEKATYDMEGITFEGLTVPYDGKTHPLAIKGQLPTGVNVSYENNAQTAAGQYEVIAHFTGDKTNYQEIPDKKATLIIEQATVEGITFEGLTVTYDGNTHPLKIKGDLPAEVSVRYENNDQVNAGEYEVKAIFDTGKNYKPLAEMTAKLIIEQATVEGITFAGKTVTYNGETQSLKITGDLPAEVSVRYENNDQVNVGEYEVKAIFDTGKNYKPLAEMTAKLVIEKATYDMKNITFEGKTITYDGNTHPLAIQGQLPKDVQVSYENNEQTTAGRHEVIAHFTGDETNYNKIDDMKATLIIEKANYKMDGITFDGETLTYDGSEHSLKIKGDLPAGVDVSYEGNGKKNVGVYSVKAHFTGDETNYNPIDDKSATLTIEKRELTVKIIGKTAIVYDRQEHKDYSVQATNLIEGDSVTFILSYSGNMIDMGEYTVKATIEEHQNYKLTKDNALTVVITRTTHKVTFRQENQPDQVVEVADLAGISQEQIPTPVAENGYDVKWQDVDLSCITDDMTVQAVKTPITYTIRYYLDEGDNNSFNPQTYDITTATITLAAPTKNGYTFLGWFKDSLSGSQIREIVQGSTGNLNLYAKWILTEYEITYNNLYNGKNHSDNPKTYNIQTEYSFGEATRDGYTFAGWFKDSAFGEQVTEIKRGSQGPLVIYAKWDIVTYDIHYHMNEGTNNQANPQTYDVETATITLATPTRDYYDFAGWYKDARFNTQIREISLGSFGELDLYAKWTPIDYTITYNTDGGVNNDRNPKTYNIETPTIELKDATKDGYTFLGWFTSRSGDEKVERIDLGSHGNMNLYARWIAYTLTTKADLELGGTVSEYNATAITAGKNVTITAKTSDGYTYLGWYNGDTLLTREFSYTFDMPQESLVYTAKWIAFPVTIEISMEGAGTFSGIPATSKLGDSVTVVAAVNAGYNFLGWYKDDIQLTESLSYTFDISEEKAVFTAKYNAYTVTVKNWGDCSVVGSVGHTVTFDLNGAEGTPPETQFVTDKVGLRYPEIPQRSDYVFRGWYTTNNCKELLDFSAPITEDITLYAGWYKMERPKTSYLNSYGQFDAFRYNNASNCRTSVLTSPIVYYYFTVLTSGNYQFYVGANMDAYCMAKLENITTGKKLASTALSWGTFNFYANAGNVIRIELSKTNANYSPTFYFYVSGVRIPDDGGLAEGAYSLDVGSATNVSVGSMVKLQTTADDGYTFLGWFKNDEEVAISTDQSYVFTMTSENVVYTAKWAKDPLPMAAAIDTGGDLTKSKASSIARISNIVPLEENEVGEAKGEANQNTVDYSELVAALIASGGVILSILASLLTAHLTLRFSYRQLFAETVSKNRMEWINVWRENISTFLACAEILHRSQSTTAFTQESINQYLQDMYKAQLMITSRLNMEEKLHKEIAATINGFSYTANNAQFTENKEEILDLARQILKIEWDRVKLEAQGKKPNKVKRILEKNFPNVFS